MVHYGNRKKLFAKLEAKRRADGKGKDWSPTLRQMLKAMLDSDDEAFDKTHPWARKALSTLIDDDKKSVISIESMDAFAHNNFAWPSEGEIRRHWKILEQVLIVVLSEPKT